MHKNNLRAERAILVGVILKNQPAEQEMEYLDELVESIKGQMEIIVAMNGFYPCSAENSLAFAMPHCPCCFHSCIPRPPRCQTQNPPQAHAPMWEHFSLRSSTVVLVDGVKPLDGFYMATAVFAANRGG